MFSWISESIVHVCLLRQYTRRWDPEHYFFKASNYFDFRLKLLCEIKVNSSCGGIFLVKRAYFLINYLETIVDKHTFWKMIYPRRAFLFLLRIHLRFIIFLWLDRSFILPLNNILCLDVPQFIHSPIEGLLGCFLFGAIMNNAAICVHVEIPVWT